MKLSRLFVVIVLSLLLAACGKPAEVKDPKQDETPQEQVDPDKENHPAEGEAEGEGEGEEGKEEGGEEEGGEGEGEGSA